MKITVTTFASFLFLFFITACSKDPSKNNTDVVVISPVQNASYLLPDTMRVSASIKSSAAPLFVRIGVIDEKGTPVNPPAYFYPDEKDILIQYDYYLDLLDDEVTGPFMFDLAVDDGYRISNTYVPVQLANGNPNFKGLVSIEQSSVQTITIRNFDDQFKEISQAKKPGSYVDAEFSETNGLLLLATSLPYQLNALDVFTYTKLWTQQAEAPYPEFTSLLYDKDGLYVAYANERISLLNDKTGQLITGTRILVDSVPQKIGVTDDFFLGDFTYRTKPGGCWVSFYKETAALYHKYETDMRVVDIYQSGKKNIVDVIGNEDGKGSWLQFDVQTNTLTGTHFSQEMPFDRSCRVSQGNYLVSSANGLYEISMNSNTSVQLLLLNDTIKDIVFEPLNNHLIVALKSELIIYNFPELSDFERIETPGELTAIKLIYDR